MKQYKKLLKHVLEHGRERTDRTGTGTYSVFGYQMRFNLAEGFPLVTTKQVPIKLVIGELLWMLSGSTKDDDLRALSGVPEDRDTIWAEWADGNGNLGPIYGHQWRKWGGRHCSRKQPTPILPGGVVPNTFGVGFAEKIPQGGVERKLYESWKAMLARCYVSSHDAYPYYGGIGVHVCSRWLVLSAFIEDASTLPGWVGKNAEWSRYQLDKDILGDGFEYSPSKCHWVTRETNARGKYRYRHYLQHEDGSVVVVDNPVEFYTDRGLHQGNFCSMLRGERKTAQGWSLLRTEDTTKGVDQLSEVLRQLKETPDSRRIIVSAWNVGELDKMALPPCHAFFQFYTEELTPGERHDCAKKQLQAQGCNMEEPGAFKQIYDEDGEFLPWVPRHRLSCQLYQRSADLFLGVPFNIASYALLTMMVAQVCGMAVGDFVWTGGDCHIYKNHLNQVRMQLERQEYPLPRMVINKEVKDLFSFVYDDFTLEGYTCWPAIKAPVAV